MLRSSLGPTYAAKAGAKVGTAAMIAGVAATAPIVMAAPDCAAIHAPAGANAAIKGKQGQMNQSMAETLY